MGTVVLNQSTLRDVVLLLCKTPAKKTLELFDDTNEVVLTCEADDIHIHLTVPFDNLKEAAWFNRECVAALNYSSE